MCHGFHACEVACALRLQLFAGHHQEYEVDLPSSFATIDLHGEVIRSGQLPGTNRPLKTNSVSRGGKNRISTEAPLGPSSTAVHPAAGSSCSCKTCPRSGGRAQEGPPRSIPSRSAPPPSCRKDVRGAGSRPKCYTSYQHWATKREKIACRAEGRPPGRRENRPHGKSLTCLECPRDIHGKHRMWKGSSKLELFSRSI